MSTDKTTPRYRVVSARCCDGPYRQETYVRLVRVVTVEWSDGVGKPVWEDAPVEVELKGLMPPADFMGEDAEFVVSIRKVSR